MYVALVVKSGVCGVVCGAAPDISVPYLVWTAPRAPVNVRRVSTVPKAATHQRHTGVRQGHTVPSERERAPYVHRASSGGPRQPVRTS